MSFTLYNSELEQIIQRQNELLSHIELPAATKALLDPNPELTAHIAYMEQLSVLHSPIYEVAPTLRNLMHQNQIMISNISAGISALSDAIKALPDLSNVSHAVSMAAKAMSHIDKALILNAATTFQHYADSYRTLYSHIDWDSLRNESLGPSIDDKVIEHWYDMTAKIADDMVKVGWVAEKEKPTIDKTSFFQLPIVKKIWHIISVLAVLSSLTGFSLKDVIQIVLEPFDDSALPYKIERELTLDEVKIITCQTELINSVQNELSAQASQAPFAISDTPLV